MTSLRTPVWEDNEIIKFALLDEGEEWTKSAFVRITPRATGKALKRANERMSNVQCLRMSVPHGNESVFTLLEKAAMPNLRALCFDLLLNDQMAAGTANALRHNAQVEQAELQLRQTSEQSTIILVDALSTLPLTALRLTFWTNLSQQSIDRFCALLHQKRDTLVSLEIVLLSDDKSFVNDIVSKGMCALQHLRLLRFLCRALDEIRMPQLCKALEFMPYLAALIVTVDQVSTLAKFFSTSFRPITSFQFNTALEVADSHMTDLLNALKRNTRLRSLNVTGDRLQRVLESGLAEEGFLTRVVNLYTGKDADMFEPLLERNKARHTACKRACVCINCCASKARRIEMDFA